MLGSVAPVRILGVHARVVVGERIEAGARVERAEK
jgi:hypothetical protein